MTRQINPIARFAVERPVTMGMAVLGVLVLGWISLTRLPLEFLPSFSSDSITVRAPYPSSSPEEVERLIVQPLEDTLATLNGVETLASTASADGASVRLTFVEGTDMDMAAVEVRDRIDRARRLLPGDLERITLRRFQSSDIPVLSMHVSARWPRARLFDFAENVLLRRLERLEGVAQVSLGGLQSPVVMVELDPARMRAHGVDVRELAREIARNHVNLSAGDVRDGGRELLVRAVGEMRTLETLRRLPLGRGEIRLGDVADVAYTFPEQEEFNYLNGVEALTLRVNKASEANLLAVVERVKDELDAVLALPEAEGLAFRIYHDASTDVREGLSELSKAGLVGGGLAILAVFFFLRRFRTTALIALALPISVVGTFVLIYFLRQAGVSDITLNVVSLAGLMLALGMLVDNSVVVIESIFRHRNDLGEDARTAALRGTSEVALPILASTATTLCVFVPLIFLEAGGRMAFYLEHIATTISIVIAASLLVALTVVPMAAARLLRGQESRRSRLIGGMINLYGRALGFTLRHRFAFVVVIVSLLGGSIYLLTTIERAFTVRSEERQVVLHVDTPRQYSFEQTKALYEEIYALLEEHREELDVADVAYEFDRGTGRSRGGWGGGRRFEIYLADESESTLSTAEARDRLRELLPVKAGVNLRIAQGRGHGASTGIEVELSGDDPAVLRMMSERVAGALRRLPMLKDVDTSLESGAEEIRVGVDRERALQAGLSSQAVGFTIRNALSSRPVAYFKTGDREVDLVVQYREDDRRTLDQLKNLAVFGGSPLPLGALADFEVTTGPSSIEREDHRPQVKITGNVSEARASFAALGAVRRVMSEISLPPGYSWSFGRWTRYMEQDQESGLFALVFAAVLIYMLMASLFESFAQPFTIMFSVPFALLGVAVVMKLAEQPWDAMTMIGLIILLGVVVNNAIVLIDHVNQLRRAGLERDRAIVQGGQDRLRPILITAVTTIFGLLPMVAPILFPFWLGPVEGRASNWAPIGLVILGGLTTSTFLTLMIIPTIYSLIDDVTRFSRRVAAAVGGKRMSNVEFGMSNGRATKPS